MAGALLDVRWRDGRIELEPAATPVKLVRKGRLLVAAPVTEVEPLTAEAVEETRRALQDERASES